MTYRQWLMSGLRTMFSKQELSQPVFEGAVASPALFVTVLFLSVFLNIWLLFFMLIPIFTFTHALYRKEQQ